MLTVLLAALAAFSPLARAVEAPADCPAGTHRALTGDRYQPFECVKEDPRKGFGAVTGPRGFKERPKCPRGTHVEESADGLQRYRCVSRSADPADPDLAPITPDQEAPARSARVDEDPLELGCPPGKRKVRTNDPLRPFQCAARPPRLRKLRDSDYRPYRVAGEFSLEYPRMLQPRDAWKEEVPTLSFTLDDGGLGKPVMITVAKVTPAQAAYLDIEGAVSREREWQAAQDGGTVPAAGARARITFVPGESKTAYIPLPRGAYYTVVYSAPSESYEVYLAAFERLLRTLTVARRSK